MTRSFAAFLAIAISLAAFATVFVAVSWFMQFPLFFGIITPRSGLTLSFAISILICFVVPFLGLIQQRKRSADQIDPSEANKPAPRLWMRSLQPPEE